MAIAFDTSVDVGLNATTWSHTCSGSDRLLIVVLFSTNNPGGVTITYGGVAMTKQATLEGYSAALGQGHGYVYTLINPPSGTNTVSVNYSDVTIYSSSYSYSGVKQTGFPDSSAQNAGFNTTSVTVTTTVVASNCWVMGIGVNALVGSTISSGKTDRLNKNVLGGSFVWCDSNGVVAAGSQSVTYTSGISGAFPAGSWFSIEPAPASVANKNSGFFNI